MVLVITLNVNTIWNISETTVYIVAQMINALISINKQTVISTRNYFLFLFRTRTTKCTLKRKSVTVPSFMCMQVPHIRVFVGTLVAL